MPADLAQRRHRLVVREMLNPRGINGNQGRNQISAALPSTGSNKVASVFFTLPTRVLTG